VQLRFDVPSPLEYFAILVGSDREFALLEAASSLAQDDYPDLDLESVRQTMDDFAERLRRRVPQSADPVQKLALLNAFFYRDLGFAGNLNDFYEPDNSFLHAVLQRRRGIPVSLALLWIELARGLGLTAHGVSYPGHFLVKVILPNGQLVLDPLNGKPLSREQLVAMLDSPPAPLALLLQAAPPRSILARMLRNLKEIYRMHQDWDRLLKVQERLVVLLPTHWGEVRDRGLAHAGAGRRDLARRDLDLYLEHVPDAPEIDSLARWLQEPPGPSR
jgi:regulator of sirC expression with transglutaminase-like and TPR domain